MSEEQRARLSDVVPNPNPPPLVPLAPKKITRPADYENLGNMAASLWFSGGETIFGDEWRPNPAESDGVPKAFTAYFRAKEIGDIPPGVALCLALGTYSVARITRPTVKARFVQGWLWVKGRWSSWRRGGR
jgi:hypothetical protein